MNRPFLVLLLYAAFAAPALAQDDVATLIERGYLRKAETLLAARVAAAPTDGEALARLARIRVEQGNLDEAMKLAERAVAVAPGSADAHYALAEVNGAKAQRVGALSKMGPARKFKKEADAALAIDPRHMDALEGMIAFHRQAPGIVGGDKKKIPEMIERLSSADPARGWSWKANEADNNQDSVTCEAHLRKAAEVGGPDERMALANWLSPPWRKPAEAERIAREVLEKEPWRQGAWSLIAVLQARTGRLEELDATLAAAEAGDPGRLGATYSAGRTLVVEKKDPARAEKYLRRYLAVPPEIGWPTHAGAHWRLGLALEQQGRRDEAVAEIQIAVRDQPDLEGAKKDLKRLSR
jgi:tetratricopeptide (TPR) repeat protein